jgi:lysophospholipase L1-like esterase
MQAADHGTIHRPISAISHGAIAGWEAVKLRTAGVLMVVVGLVGAIAAGTAGVAAAKGRTTAKKAAANRPHKTVAPASLLLVGLGDSVPAGADCSGCTSFVTLYADRLGAAVDNDGVDGQNSAQLLDAISPGGTESADVAAADVITLTIGANDFNSGRAALQNGTCADLTCFGNTVQTMQANVQAIITEIQKLHSDQQVAINVTGYWNVFQDGAVAANRYGTAFLQASDALTRQANTAIKQAADKTGATYVDIYTPIKAHDPDTSLLSPDGDHLSQSGHDLVAATLAAHGTAPK